jgi:hypothetical protein
MTQEQKQILREFDERGEKGYASNTVYDTETATFRTFENLSNRMIITVWKHDEWYYT